MWIQRYTWNTNFNLLFLGSNETKNGENIEGKLYMKIKYPHDSDDDGGDG